MDTGLRSYLSGHKSADIGRVFENAVFLQLLYEGWSVHVGKLYQKEIDFIARRNGETLYVQATDSMELESTREREVAPLLSLRDAHRKVVAVRQLDRSYDINGVEILAASDFFLT